MKTFVEWLKGQIPKGHDASKRDGYLKSPLQDLAFGLIRDTGFVPINGTPEELESWIHMVDGCYQALDALKKAKKSYSAYVRKEARAS